MGQEDAESCRLCTVCCSSREPLSGKAKDLNHRRRCGKRGALSRVLSIRGVGMGEHVSSGSGWVTHTQQLRSPQAQPEAQREEVLSSCRDKPRDHHKSALLTLSLRLPQNILGMPSAGIQPRWVRQHCWRRWQRGSLCFLTSAWLCDRAR